MDKDKLIRNLPAMEAPTINSLSDGAVAIETIVPKNVMSDTIIVIKQGGGNILIQDITVTI
jgi:ATP phosphoribosyltransferase